MREKLANWHASRLRSHVSSSDLEFAVINGNELDVQIWNPDDPPVPVNWDHSMYANGNQFIRAPDGSLYANPVKPVPNEDEDTVELKASEEYRRAMNQKLTSDIVNAMEGTGDSQLKMMMYIIIVLNIVVMAIQLVLNMV